MQNEWLNGTLGGKCQRASTAGAISCFVRGMSAQRQGRHSVLSRSRRAQCFEGGLLFQEIKIVVLPVYQTAFSSSQKIITGILCKNSFPSCLISFLFSVLLKFSGGICHYKNIFQDSLLHIFSIARMLPFNTIVIGQK